MIEYYSNIFVYILITSILLITVACNEDQIHSENKTFKGNQWTWQDPFRTNFKMRDTSQVYDLNLDLIHDESYAYQNIYLSVKTEFPGDTAITTLLPIDLARKTGDWYGKCSSGKCKLRVYLQERIRFKQPGDYSITFEQYTRNDTLDGLESISFTIKKSKS